MSEVKNLLIAQIDTIAQVKRVLVNFKKLAKANVTLPRTQRRLDELQSLWASCRELHVKLLQSTTPEEQNTLSYFLDKEFLVAEEIHTDWFQKKTFSGRLLSVYSNHPICHKKGIIYNLVDRAILLSHPMFQKKNLELIIEMLLIKGYHLNMIFS